MRLHLRIGKHRGHVVDRRARHAHRGEGFDPGRDRARHHDRRDDGDHVIAMTNARLVGREASVVEQRAAIGRAAEALELRVVAGGEHHVAIARMENLRRHHARMTTAHATGDNAGTKPRLRGVDHGGDLHVEQRHVDVLAATAHLPMHERRDDAQRGIHAGHHVDHGDAGALRTTTGQIVALAGHAHQAAQRLRDRIVSRSRCVGTGLAVTGHRAIDQPRIDRGKCHVVEAVAGKVAHLEVLDQHVGAGREFAHQCLAIGVGEIDRDQTLAAIGAQEIRALAGFVAGGVAQVGRPPGTRVVATAGTLHLDHIRAEIREDPARRRAGENPCQVKDPDTGERPHC